MVWLTIGLGTLVLLLAMAFMALRKGTLYIPNSRGYVAFTIGERDPYRRVTREQFASLLPVLFEAKAFDFLQVSHVDGEMEDAGIVLSVVDGHVELSCDFLPAHDEDAIRKFKDALKAEGYEPTEERPWNVGMGPDLESLSVDCHFPFDGALVGHLALAALNGLQGYHDGDLYIRAALIADGPGKGIQFEKRHDPLEEIL